MTREKKEFVRPFEQIDYYHKGNIPTSCHIIKYGKIIGGSCDNQLVFIQERIDGNNVMAYIAQITEYGAFDYEKSRTFKPIANIDKHEVERATMDEAIEGLEKILKIFGGELVMLNNTEKTSQ